MSTNFDDSRNRSDIGGPSNSTVLQEPIDIQLLAAESVIWTEKNVAYIGPFGKFPGKVVITRYRMVFLVGDHGGKHYKRWKLDVPLGQVSKVEKIGGQSRSAAMRRDDNYGFIVLCKDYRNYKFACLPTSNRKSICDALNRYAFPNSHNFPLFAFVHAAESPRSISDGWKIYSAEGEYERLGIPSSRLWEKVDINKDYKFSETYPRVFVIPKATVEKGKVFLKKVGEYRSKERIPVLSWIDQNTLASISRCSQPMTGLASKKCIEDEIHLANIMSANANCRELLILDARPAVNAKLMKAKGGGYEDNYTTVSLTFLNIHNIHVVRDSLKRMVSTLLPRVDEKNFYKVLDGTKWLHHVQSILEGALKAVFNVDTEKQTIEGFIVLIEKEWCSFGHKFGQRIGHGEDSHGDGERSPIFVQFFDCVWQIMRQFPWAFEFTQDLLIYILDELYSCRYGTFLFNSEKIRLLDNKCAETTRSLWSYVLENKEKFTNPIFRVRQTKKVLYVNPSFCVLQVWVDYYARFNPHLKTPQHEDIQHSGTPFVNAKKHLMGEIMALEESINNADE